MTKEQLAELLNGREYQNEMTKEEETRAEDEDLLVIFGASDDLMELRGVIMDEAGIYNGGTVRIKDGKLFEAPDRDEKKTLKKYGVLAQIMGGGFEVEAIWDGGGYSWQYRTDVPHASFDIMEDGEKYCRGIVIDMTEVPG